MVELERKPLDVEYEAESVLVLALPAVMLRSRPALTARAASLCTVAARNIYCDRKCQLRNMELRNVHATIMKTNAPAIFLNDCSSEDFAIYHPI